MLPMTLRRRPMIRVNEPFRDIDELFNQMITSFGNGGSDEPTAAYPVDIREDDAHIFVDAEMPGFTKDQVDVTLDAGVLSITAERKEEKTTDKQKRHLHERRFTRVERRFSLPSAVNEGKVDAKLTDGVLHVTLAKTKEAQPHRVKVL